jgi:hypothetical protein
MRSELAAAQREAREAGAMARALGERVRKLEMGRGETGFTTLSIY